MLANFSAPLKYNPSIFFHQTNEFHLKQTKKTFVAQICFEMDYEKDKVHTITSPWLQPTMFVK